MIDATCGPKWLILELPKRFGCLWTMIQCSLVARQRSKAVISHVLNTPGREEHLIRETQRWLIAPDRFAVFSLSENGREPSHVENNMSSGGAGFVVAFDSHHPAFGSLKSPGLIGGIEDSDEPISSFLSHTVQKWTGEV